MQCSVYMNQTLVCFWPGLFRQMRTRKSHSDVDQNNPKTNLNERLDCNSMLIQPHPKLCILGFYFFFFFFSFCSCELQKCDVVWIIAQIDKKRKIKAGRDTQHVLSFNYIIIYLPPSLCSLCTWQICLHRCISDK